MKFGFQLPTGREGLSLPTPFFRPADFVSMAQTAERLGYDSVWGNDHYAPQDYVRARYSTPPNFWDPLMVHAAVAAATSRIQVGTCVLVLPMREMAVTAKQIATLDQLSGGRLLLGVGIGAYREEFAAARPELVGKDRGAMLEEGLALLNRLFSEPSVTHHGRYYHVESFDLDPKPRQQPFPILVGGHQQKGLDRVIRYGQGWLPGWRPFDELKEWIARLRDKAAEVGRDPASLIVAPQFSALVGRTQEEAEQRYQQSAMVQHRVSLAYTGRDPDLALHNNLIGCPEHILEQLEALRGYGADHLAGTSFCVNSAAEMSEQVHFFAEAVVRPYRLSHGQPDPAARPSTNMPDGGRQP
jgi:probable F420-dependent oxidoreductase